MVWYPCGLSLTGVPNNFLPLMKAFLMYKFTAIKWNVSKPKLSPNYSHALALALHSPASLPLALPCHAARQCLTFSADASTKVMTQLKWILNSNAGWYPHLFKLGEMSGLSDGHHQFLVIPGSREKVEEPNPEITHSHSVLTPAWPLADDLPVGLEPGIPTIHHVLWLVRTRVHLL